MLMLPTRFSRVAVSLLLWSLIATSAVSAQNFTGDARSVGMGGSTKNTNIAMSMVDPFARYAVIPIPIGLLQVLGNKDAFDPTSDKFDPAWAIEAASNPLHYQFGRKTDSSDSPQALFMRDLVNGTVSRDLATYSSFHMPDSVSAEGLASPAWGGTIKFAKQSSGAFQGVFIGAGPYFSFGTDATIDPRLSDILENGAHYANSSLTVQDSSRVQLAAAIVVGYRARVVAGGGGDRDGVYLAAN